MPYFRSIAIAITLLVSSASINAQTQIGIANCSISGSDFSASGTCAITPFGPMMVSAGLAIMSKSQTANLQFTFSSGTGTFSASALNQAYTVGMNSVAIQGNANITAGTGMFADASGSFAFNFVGMGPANTETATLAGSGTINVQISLSATLPGATVGVPYSSNVRQGLSLIPSGAQFGLSTGSSLPPGLTLSASGLLSGTPTETGNYSISVTVTGTTESGTLQLSLTVTANPSPAVTVTPGALNFSLTEGSTSHSVTESIVIANGGSSTENFTATASTNSGGNWLSLSGTTGTVAPFTNSSVSVSVDPSGLSVGTYLGTISIKILPDNQQFDVAVLATLSGGQAQVQISQSGFRFETVAGGSSPRSQSLSIINSGSGPLKFSASASTTSGGQWLSVSPASGSVTSSAPASAAAP